MSTISKYLCKFCGKQHSLLFGAKAPLNTDIQELIDSKSDRIISNDVVHMLDKTSVIFPVSLEIATTYDEAFSYLCWVSFEAKAFIEMTEQKHKSEEVDLEGALLHDLLPLYPDTKGLRVKAIFKLKEASDDAVKIVVVEESKVMTDQTNGLSKERFHELISEVYHPELRH